MKIPRFPKVPKRVSKVLIPLVGVLGGIGILVGIAKAHKAEAQTKGQTPSPGPGPFSPSSTLGKSSIGRSSSMSVSTVSGDVDPNEQHYLTPVEYMDFHPKGGLVPFGSDGTLVTALPLIDTRTGLFARPTAESLEAFAKGINGGALLTKDDIDRIEQDHGHIEFTPLVFGGDDSLHMQSLAFAKREDEAIWGKLAAKGYDGTYPINVAKDWIDDPGTPDGMATNYGAFSDLPLNPKQGGPYLETGPRLGAQGAHMFQQRGTRHNRQHGDYSQLGRIKVAPAKEAA